QSCRCPCRVRPRSAVRCRRRAPSCRTRAWSAAPAAPTCQLCRTRRDRPRSGRSRRRGYLPGLGFKQQLELLVRGCSAKAQQRQVVIGPVRGTPVELQLREVVVGVHAQRLKQICKSLLEGCACAVQPKVLEADRVAPALDEDFGLEAMVAERLREVVA